jgi:aminocarboxymuconate-semialdehyde decarboxylase
MATVVKTKRIDADTHFNLTIDYKNMRDILSRGQQKEMEDMMWQDGWRFADPRGARSELQRRQASSGGRASAGPARFEGADPERDPEARIQAMERMGFDMQILITQTVLPAPLKPDTEKPLWLRQALSQLYNDAAIDVQRKYPDRFIGMATIPWDDLQWSINELDRVTKGGLKVVYIAGNWMGKNLDTYELYPYWEAVNDLGIVQIVHQTPQGCGGAIIDHSTPYPMVGTERFHRLHIGTYLGFGLEYAVAATALTLGGVVDEFPNLKFLFYEAGAGWFNYAQLGADRSFYIEPQCARTKTPPSELMKKHCFTAVENLEPVEQIVAAYGSDNYFIGTDFPHPEWEYLPNSTGDIADKNLADEDKSKILGGNIARVLGIQ